MRRLSLRDACAPCRNKVKGLSKDDAMTQYIA